MKKVIAILLMISIVGTMTGINNRIVKADETDSSEIIENNENGIPDKNLYDAVLEQWDTNKDGKLSIAEATIYDTLNLSQKNISSIKGINYFTKLKNLYLDDNNISDISSLNKIKNLAFVSIKNNKITTLENCFAESGEIFALDLSGNQIVDTKGLEKLEEITYLTLADNQISDISNLPNHIFDADFSNNQIQDINSLLKVKDSLYNLNLENNKISDISCLKQIPNLQIVDIRYNKISDISVFQDCTWLWDDEKWSQEDYRFDETFVSLKFAVGNEITLEDELLYVPEIILNNIIYSEDWKSDTGKRWIDIEGFTSTYVKDVSDEGVTGDVLDKIISENSSRNVTLRTVNNTLYTFEKNTMNIGTKEKYNFSEKTIEENDGNFIGLPDEISKENVKLEAISQDEGKLPAKAVVSRKVGKEYAGQTLCFGEVLDGKVANMQYVVVDKNGYINVTQSNFGTFIVYSGETDEAELLDKINSADAGKTVETVLNNTTILSQNILSALKQKNINLKVALNDSTSWCIYGEKLKDNNVQQCNLLVTRTEKDGGKIPANIIDAQLANRLAEQISFGEDTSLGFQATLMLKKEDLKQQDKGVLLQYNGSTLHLVDSTLITEKVADFSVNERDNAVVVYGVNGDTDGDNKVKIKDAMQILQQTSNRKAMNEVQKGFADTDCNNKINLQDVMHEMHYISGRSNSNRRIGDGD